MTGTDHFLSEDDIRYLRGLEARIAEIEKTLIGEVPLGAMIGYRPPARSAAWSDTHFEAVASNWTHWYMLNELQGAIKDQTGNAAFDGSLQAATEANLPLLGQIGGMSSDGGYSVYFPGKEKSRIELPLLLAKEREWSMEVIFKPEILPQEAAIFYHGNNLVDGYGMGILSSKLLLRSPAGSIETGITLIAGQWYDVIFIATSSELYWFVSTINPLTKAFTITNGNVVQPSVSMPTTRSVIGCRGPTGELPFKGWIQEAVTCNFQLGAGLTPQSVYDRIRCALEPAAPYGFAKTDGINVSRSKYSRLFSRLGTQEGAGDGVNTFALPNVANSIIRI